MFNEQYEYIVKLFKEVRELIGGHVLCKEYKTVRLLKEDVILEYQFSDRDDMAHFIYLMPYSLGDFDFSIERKRGKIATAWLDGHMKEILDFTVAANNERSQSLMIALFNDYQFKNQLIAKLDDWKIECKDETLSFKLTKNAQPLFGKNVKAEELKEIFDLILEFKDAMSFHYKRV